MTADEIRKERDRAIDTFAEENKTVRQDDYGNEIAFWLGIFLPEIAAQLAESNEAAKFNTVNEKLVETIAAQTRALLYEHMNREALFAHDCAEKKHVYQGKSCWIKNDEGIWMCARCKAFSAPIEASSMNPPSLIPS